MPTPPTPITVLSHGNFERIFNLFLGSATISDPSLKAKAGNTFAEMPEDVACNQAIYNFFATYLVYSYTSSARAAWAQATPWTTPPRRRSGLVSSTWRR